MKNLDVLTIGDLRLILAIADEGSLTAGAVKTRMRQSAASYSLKKIQAAFRTDLFVRKGRNLVPSEFGWHVCGYIKAMIADFENVLYPPDFDPNVTFTLSFGATEYDIAAVFPHIQSLLKKHAPLANLKIVALDTASPLEQLNTLDFLFAPVNIASSSIRALEVLTDDVVVFYDQTKRQAPARLADFVAAPHAIASFDGSDMTHTDYLLGQRGLQRRIAVSAYGFAAVASLIEGTDMITTMPKRLKNTLFANLAHCPPPFGEESMKLYLCWLAAKEERGKIQWFTRLLRENPLPIPQG